MGLMRELIRRRVQVGDTELPDFMTRWLSDVRSEQMISESADWQWIADQLHDGETRWVRTPVKFLGASKGFVFVTDQRIFFAFGNETHAFDLRDVAYAGSPVKGGCDFLVNVRVPDSPGGHMSVLMNLRDRAGFYAFYPSLCVRIAFAKGLPK